MLNLKKMFRPKFRTKEIITPAGNVIRRNYTISYEDDKNKLKEKEKQENLKILNKIICQYKLNDNIANKLKSNVNSNDVFLLKMFYFNNLDYNGKAFNKFNSFEQWQILYKISKETDIKLNNEIVDILMEYYKINGFDFINEVSNIIQFYSKSNFKNIIEMLSKNEKEYGNCYIQYITKLIIINQDLISNDYNEYLSIDDFNILYPIIIGNLNKKSFNSFFTAVAEKINKEHINLYALLV